MATFGPNQFGAVAEFDDGWAAFTNAGNAITDNDGYATVALDPGSEIYNSNFLDYGTAGITEPADADNVTDIFIEVAVKETDSGETTRLYTVQLLVGGSPVGDPYEVNQAFSTSEAYVGLTGSVAGNFNTTLTGAQVKASGFGARIQFQASGASTTVSVDAARVSGTYTPSGGGGGQPYIARVSGVPGARLGGASFGRGW